MKKYIILGASSLLSSIFDLIHDNGGRVHKIYQNVAENIEEGKITIKDRVGFLDYDVEVFDSMDSFKVEEGYEYVLGFVSMQKYKFVEQLKKKYGLKFATLIHSSVYMGSNVSIGEGVVLFPRVVLDSNVSLGNYTVINRSSMLGHDTKLGEHILVAPSAAIAGHVRIEDKCFIGLNATVIDGITIGQWSFIGAGSVVTKNIEPEVIAYGNPARVARKNDAADFSKYLEKRSIEYNFDDDKK